MAMGGGFWVTQNKVLPGTYHNFVSASRAFVNLSNRGYVAVPIALKWGEDDGVMTVTSEDFQTKTLEIFGYDYTAPEMKGLRDVFKNATTAFIKKLPLTGAAAAENIFATAKYKGTRGNDLKVEIKANVDDSDLFDVISYLGDLEIDRQLGVVDAAALVPNDFMTFKTGATLAVAAATPLAGGVDGTGVETGTPHQTALDELESYGFNVLACLSSNDTIKQLYVEYAKRIRNEVGAKFQVVVHKANIPDMEGIINEKNDAIGDGEELFGMVYWTTGASAGVGINESNTNRLYDGEHTPDMSETNTQAKLIDAVKNGYYAFHRVGDDFRVLEDINSFTSFTVDKNEDFAQNQLIRIIDQIAIDTANLFNTRYLGKVPNDADGRISLWNDIGSHRFELQRLRAIQNYDINKLIISQGNQKNAVLASEEIEWTSSMTKLYITTVVA